MKLDIKNGCLSLASLVALATTGGVAHADLLTVRAEARAGGIGGKGMFGERKAEAFQEGHGAFGYGFLLGAEVFFIDGWIEHNQYLNGGVDGTWTQFMLGVDVTMNIGDEKPNGETPMFVELGMGFGFGVGTGQQVDPPLDNSEVTDKGFLLEGRTFLGYRVAPLVSVGLTVPVQFGYFTKAGPGTTSNNVDNHYAGISGAGLLTVRAGWEIK